MRPGHSLRKQNMIVWISNVPVCRICYTNTKIQSRTLIVLWV